MNIQVNSDHNIQGSEELNIYIREVLSNVCERYNSSITRIEVHLSDENGGKFGENDKRCLLEARVSHRQPLVVTSHAGSIHEAIHISSDKLLRSLDTMVGKQIDRSSPRSILAEAEALNVAAANQRST